MMMIALHHHHHHHHDKIVGLFCNKLYFSFAKNYRSLFCKKRPIKRPLNHHHHHHHHHNMLLSMHLETILHVPYKCVMFHMNEKLQIHESCSRVKMVMMTAYHLHHILLSLHLERILHVTYK